MRRPLVLVHGYSDSHAGFRRWADLLSAGERPVSPIHIGRYVSLSNEVTLKDVAEGFDRALRLEADLGPDDEFDALVHSTGMLVVRSWLNSYSEGEARRSRLKHLVALAPATNGSPLAHKGRSWLGSVFKGSKQPGPDFMEAGDEILYGLELASGFTWDLAHDDLLGADARFRPGPETPYVFTFCGSRPYALLKRLAVRNPGSDGAVRFAGCALNSRKVGIDLRVAPGSSEEPSIAVTDWNNQHHPLILVRGKNHGTIMGSPPAELVGWVRRALDVETEEEFREWNAGAVEWSAETRAATPRWQQFVIRVVDERGDPVPDWNARLFVGKDGRNLREFALDVHTYGRDTSLRCFHVNLDRLGYQRLSSLVLRLIATAGSRLVAYHGAGSDRITPDGTALDPAGKWDAAIDLSAYLGRDAGFRLFYPFTTTFIEICLNREPMPLVGKNEVFWIPERRG